MSSSGESDLSGRLLGGRYRLLRLLGQGGMGSVYEAQHTLIDRRVAVKMLHAALGKDAELSERFMREARTASSIRHPGIIEVQDVDRDEDGALYIVMELLEGQSLGQRLRHGPIAPAFAVAVMVQVLDALEAAHQRGIVHRDLKPDNVFLVYRPGEPPQAKILDFGISKVEELEEGDVSLTRTGTVMGTPHYMAPEQARGERDLDARADVWAIGIMLYRMLSGAFPYDGDSYNRIMSRILVEPVPSLTDAVPGLPAGLVEVVDRALVKDRAQRTASAADLAEALRALNLGEVRVEDTLAAVPTPAAGADLGTDPTAAAGTPVPAAGADLGADLGTDPTAAAGTPVPAAWADLGTDPTAAAGTPVVGTVEGVEVPAPPEPEPPYEAPSPQVTSPLWKVALWYLITLPVPWIAVAADQPARAVAGILGLGEGGTALAIGYVALVVICLAMNSASVAVARYWQHGVGNRWLHGPGFAALPALGLLLVLRCHSILDSTLESILLGFHSYIPVTSNQATQTVELLERTWLQYLNTCLLVLIAVTWVSLQVTLGDVFKRRRSGHPGPGRKAWLAIPAGIVVVILAHQLFPEPLAFMGVWKFAGLLVWLLLTVALLRRPMGGAPGAGHPWRVLLTGVVTINATLALSFGLGILGLFGHVSHHNPTQPLGAWDEAMTMLMAAELTFGALLVLLCAVSISACRRSFVLEWAVVRAHGRSMGVAAVTVALAVTPMLALGVDATTAMRAIAMPMGQPGLVGMSPTSLKPEADPSFYIDAAPSTLDAASEDLFIALTGQAREAYTAEGLVSTLAGAESCPELLHASLGARENTPEASPSAPAVEPLPVRCVSAVEARLYCEERGKRLPTPEEWRAWQRGAAGGDLCEWSMRLVHGTPTFEIVGSPGAACPDQLRPDAVSRAVGFRCAFTFQGD